MMNYVLILFLFASCANPITQAKYAAYESIGIEKRDLFKKEIKNIKDDQEDTAEAFKDALERLQEMYGFDGGNLEREYNKLKSAQENAADEAGNVRSRIAKLNRVANDLFEEWTTEIKAIKTADLRSKSSEQLTKTKTQYQSLYKNLKKSEAAMTPVLDKLHDQVLFLKHNLNANAIAGLKSEAGDIQEQIKALLKKVESSNKEADQFISAF